MKDGYLVGIVIRSTSNLWRLKDVLEKLEIFDINNISVKDMISHFRPNIIIHTACHYGRGDSSLSNVVDTNLSFPIHLLEWAIFYDVDTFINTDSLLPDDINDYSLTKAQFRKWLEIKSNKIDVINLKLEHIYGVLDDNNKFIFWLINQLLNNDVKEIALTSGIQKRDFVYITDVVDAYTLALNNKNGGFESFDVGTGEYIEVREFVEEITKQLNSKADFKYYNKLKFGLKEYRKNEIMAPRLNNSKLKKIGWQPKFNYKQGISMIIKDLK